MSNVIKIDPSSLKESPSVPIAPRVMFQMVIKQMDNGTVNLTGFPANLNAALQLMSNVTSAIVNLFIEKAKTNDLDNNNTIKQSNIITLPKI